MTGVQTCALPILTDRHLCEFTLVELEARSWSLDTLMTEINSLFNACLAAVGREKIIFRSIAYAEAVKLLQNRNVGIKYGDDLSSADEKLIVSLMGDKPVFVTHYPAEPRPPEGGVIKFFSMKRNDDDTVECCDLLLPGVGEAVGGAVREGNPKIACKQFKESWLHEHIKQAGLDPDESFEWYFETLIDDGTWSTGCGIGFERMAQWLMGAKSIKDCVEFPRSPDCLSP